MPTRLPSRPVNSVPEIRERTLLESHREGRSWAHGCPFRPAVTQGLKLPEGWMGGQGADMARPAEGSSAHHQERWCSSVSEGQGHTHPPPRPAGSTSSAAGQQGQGQVPLSEMEREDAENTCLGPSGPPRPPGKTHSPVTTRSRSACQLHFLGGVWRPPSSGFLVQHWGQRDAQPSRWRTSQGGTFQSECPL